ncbi:GDSL esterase/lipase At5g45960-like [Coffea arabica]|uniref:GDSL esterase/lipase At5g45960-like n=1 Tax=Coffea arabica TaxID=13443 RepID=A0A6P6WAJ1_COFAR|nr:GDSL esterase/lipase At5g45960-like [Coffea arabica]
MNSPYGFLLPLLICYSLVFFSANTIEAGTKSRKLRELISKNSISSVFVFGDSTVDPGNNDYIGTAFKSNFPPYGEDFFDHIPTGRFSDGRLVTDYLAEYVGLKETIPPYLDPTLSVEELITGVSFASAGSGFDPLTAKLSGVIPMQQQLNYFREYKARIEKAIGEKKAKELINKASFLISCGTNDYVVNYFNNPIMQINYTVSAYQKFLLDNAHQLLKGLIDEGARNIGLVGLPPMGCLPVVITLNSISAFHRNCIEKYSSAARSYNEGLQEMVASVRRSDINVVYGDIYNPINDMIQNPSKYGFEDINTGCCGTGLIEGSFLCNQESPVCPDPSKFIFWDAVHPTQAAYYHLFKSLRSLADSFMRG